MAHTRLLSNPPDRRNPFGRSLTDHRGLVVCARDDAQQATQNMSGAAVRGEADAGVDARAAVGFQAALSNQGSYALDVREPGGDLSVANVSISHVIPDIIYFQVAMKYTTAVFRVN